MPERILYIQKRNDFGKTKWKPVKKELLLNNKEKQSKQYARIQWWFLGLFDQKWSKNTYSGTHSSILVQNI